MVIKGRPKKNSFLCIWRWKQTSQSWDWLPYSSWDKHWAYLQIPQWFKYATQDSWRAWL